MLCKSGLLSRIVQSLILFVLFVIVGVNEFVTVIVLVKYVTAAKLAVYKLVTYNLLL